MNRYSQLVVWVLLAPLFGAIQAVSSFAPVMLGVSDLRSHDLPKLLFGLTLVYGGGWFLPALFLSDLAFLRRPLATFEFRRYILIIAAAALTIGVLLPGMLVMAGYPTTACTILVVGFLHRKRRFATGTTAITSSDRPA